MHQKDLPHQVLYNPETMLTLALRQINKSFPGVRVLREIDLDIRPGEIHAICGENGAGKSTLMNILSGNLQPDDGSIMINGANTRIESPAAAFALGIAIVHQHLSLVDSMSVAENIFANRQPVNGWNMIRFRELHQQTRSLLASLNISEISPDARVSALAPAKRQLVEIAKSLSRNPSLLILDEPTAALSEKETGILFTILRDLRRRGVAVIYISHRLDEVFHLTDRVTVIKDGTKQGTFETTSLTRASLISKMVGRDIAERSGRRADHGPVVLEVCSLSGARFTNISFRLHAGEVAGLAGLSGAGRTEIARALFGVDPSQGTVRLHGRPFKPFHPADAITQSVAYVPEDRKADGLFPFLSLRDNVVAAALPMATRFGLFSRQVADAKALEATANLRISYRRIAQPVVQLSGGNQQKVMLARWLLTRPDVLIVDEPTHGVDIGAKYEIYQLLEQLASRGTAVLIISSEMPELMTLCSSVMVIRQGQLAGTLKSDEITEEGIMSLAAI